MKKTYLAILFVFILFLIANAFANEYDNFEDGNYNYPAGRNPTWRILSGASADINTQTATKYAGNYALGMTNVSVATSFRGSSPTDNNYTIWAFYNSNLPVLQLMSDTNSSLTSMQIDMYLGTGRSTACDGTSHAFGIVQTNHWYQMTINYVAGANTAKLWLQDSNGDFVGAYEEDTSACPFTPTNIKIQEASGGNAYFDDVLYSGLGGNPVGTVVYGLEGFEDYDYNSSGRIPTWRLSAGSSTDVNLQDQNKYAGSYALRAKNVVLRTAIREAPIDFNYFAYFYPNTAISVFQLHSDANADANSILVKSNGGVGAFSVVPCDGTTHNFGWQAYTNHWYNIRIYYRGGTDANIYVDDANGENVGYYQETLSCAFTPTNIKIQEASGAFTYFDNIYYGGTVPSLPIDMNIETPNIYGYLSGVSTIDLNVFGSDSNIVGVKLAYSATSGVFTNSIVNDTNLFDANAFTCTDYDFSNVTKCSFDWNTFEVNDKNYYLDVNFYSSDSNQSSVESQFIGVDNVAPNTSWNLDTNTWYNSTKNVSLTCSDDNGSGCSSTKYKYLLLPSGSFNSWQEYLIPISFSTEGKYAIDFNSTDYADQIGDTNTQFLFLDFNKPSATSDANSGWNLLGDSNITLSCVDALSGSGSIYYRLDDNNSSDLNWLPFQTYDYNLFVGQKLGKFDGNFGLQFYCTDNAGNDSNTGANYDTNYVLLEINLPPTPISVAPITGNYVSSVNISCTSGTWVRDFNYAIDFNTSIDDWNYIYEGTSSNFLLDLNRFPANTKMWFRCKIRDVDKNSLYYTAPTNILVNADSNFGSITNATPLSPTIIFTASAPFTVTASDPNNVSYCTFKIYKDGNNVLDVNGSSTAPNGNGVWAYTYTNIANGNILSATIFCVDAGGNSSNNISTSTYSASISGGTTPPSGGGGTPTIPPTELPPVTLTFSPSKVDQYWFYAPFTEPVERTASFNFILNQAIVSCSTDNPAFTCEVQEGFKVIVSVKYSDDNALGNTLTTNVYGKNAGGLIGKTMLSLRITNIAYALDARYQINSNSVPYFTDNVYIFRISNGKIIGVRLFSAIIPAILIILIIFLLVLYKTGKLKVKT